MYANLGRCLSFILMFLAVGCGKSSTAPNLEVTPSGPVHPLLGAYWLMDDIDRDPYNLQVARRYHRIITGAENEVSAPDALMSLTAAGVELVTYVDMISVYPGVTDPRDPHFAILAVLDSTDILRTPSGDNAEFWPGKLTLNITRPETRAKIATAYTTVFNQTIWQKRLHVDNCRFVGRMGWFNGGVFDHDNDGVQDSEMEFTTAWHSGEERLAELIRAGLGVDGLMIGNMAMTEIFRPDLYDGRMYEGITPQHDLPRVMASYIEASRQMPGCTFHFEADPADTAAIRLGYCLAQMGDGYFATSDGPTADPNDLANDPGWHDDMGWYSFYEITLGRGYGEATLHRNVVYSRRFEYATVVANMSNSTQTINLDGQTITIQPRDGLILQ